MKENNRYHFQRLNARNRDHARPRTAPAPTGEAMESRIREIVSPATYALTNHYHQLGLRWRILNLPLMVALVLTMIWRQVPSVSTLVQMLNREHILWEPPRSVSQQAMSLRLRSLPAELFGDIFASLIPVLLERSLARHRPQPPVVTRALSHFDRLWIIDTTTLEELFRKVGLLRDTRTKMLGGKLFAVLDLPSKLPIRLWLESDPNTNEKAFLDQFKVFLTSGTLLVFDRGFYSFPFFDWLTDHGLAFVTRARDTATFEVDKVLLETPLTRDRIIRFGLSPNSPCCHRVRMIEVCVAGSWHRYLTNVLDPSILTTADIVDLYGRRWRIEEAFLQAKRLLGLSYLWTGAFNGIHLQIWATWILYAVLIDLSDAVAEELSLPLDRISIEMVYRGLYHFVGAYSRGEATDPVIYLATQSDLGIVKRVRNRSAPCRLDNSPLELNL